MSYRTLKFKFLAWPASKSLWALWWGYKDDPEHEHMMRHVLAALEGGSETTCEPGRCVLDERSR